MAPSGIRYLCLRSKARNDDREAHPRRDYDGAPQQPLVDGRGDRRLHDLVNGHRLRAAGNRVALDGDVASRSGRGDAILHDREDHERRDRRDEENCARPHRHQFDYTVPLGARTLVCFCYQ